MHEPYLDECPTSVIQTSALGAQQNLLEVKRGFDQKGPQPPSTDTQSTTCSKSDVALRVQFCLVINAQ